jgi:hypothetical protein
MRTLLLQILLVTIWLPGAFAQQRYCFSGNQIKAINYLLDEHEWLIEQSRIDSLQLVQYQLALDASLALEKQARNESANKDTLITLTNERAYDLQESINKANKRVKRRDRLLWIGGLALIVETIVIGVSYGLSAK